MLKVDNIILLWRSVIRNIVLEAYAQSGQYHTIVEIRDS